MASIATERYVPSPTGQTDIPQFRTFTPTAGEVRTDLGLAPGRDLVVRGEGDILRKGKERLGGQQSVFLGSRAMMRTSDALHDVLKRSRDTHGVVLREYIHQVNHPHRIGVHRGVGKRTRVCHDVSLSLPSKKRKTFRVNRGEYEKRTIFNRVYFVESQALVSSPYSYSQSCPSHEALL